MAAKMAAKMAKFNFQNLLSCKKVAVIKNCMILSKHDMHEYKMEN